MTVTAPAKINLHLAVKDRRPDGYHNLESTFLALNFGDTLRFKPISGKNSVEIAMKGLDFSLPPEKNIIFKALSVFREKTGFSQGLKINVEKRIPAGGGLGGGSSDAASTLLALNKLAGCPLSKDALLEMGASIGSDIPFFIYETTAARVSGRGECIEPVEVPNNFFVLVNPGFPSDTAAAFRLLDEARAVEKNFHISNFLQVLKEPEKSVYKNIISRLHELGAAPAELSGTGSTCFGVFNEEASAKKAAALLRNEWSFVKLCGLWYFFS